MATSSLNHSQETSHTLRTLGLAFVIHHLAQDPLTARLLLTLLGDPFTKPEFVAIFEKPVPRQLN